MRKEVRILVFCLLTLFLIHFGLSQSCGTTASVTITLTQQQSGELAELIATQVFGLSCSPGYMYPHIGHWPFDAAYYAEQTLYGEALCEHFNLLPGLPVTGKTIISVNASGGPTRSTTKFRHPQNSCLIHWDATNDVLGAVKESDGLFNTFQNRAFMYSACTIIYEETSGGPPVLSCQDYYDNSSCGIGLSDGCSGFLNCTTCPSVTGTFGLPYCVGNNVHHNRTNQVGGVNSCFTGNSTCITQFEEAVLQNCNSSEVCSNGACVYVPPVSSSTNYFANFISGDPLPNGVTIEAGDYVRIISSASEPYDIFRDQDDTDIIEVVNEHYWKGVFGEVNVNFSSSDGFSENLLSVSNSVSDTPMNITILNPLCGDVINKTDTLTVLINASDPDDIITGTIKVRDTIIRSFNNLQGPNVSFDYQFNEAGNIQFIVEASNTRGESFRAVKSLIVLDNTSLTKDYYVASCIDKPENFERFTNSRIEFDARSSKGIIFHGDAAQKTTEEINNSLLQYEWNFYHSGQLLGTCIGQGFESCEGSGPATADNNVMTFTRGFSTVNNNYVTLKVSFPESLIT